MRRQPALPASPWYRGCSSGWLSETALNCDVRPPGTVPRPGATPISNRSLIGTDSLAPSAVLNT